MFWFSYLILGLFGFGVREVLGEMVGFRCLMFHPRLGSRRGRGRPPSRDIRFVLSCPFTNYSSFENLNFVVLKVQLGGQNDATRRVGGSKGWFSFYQILMISLF